MPRVCAVSGKRTRFGNKVSRRGLPKKTGGIGLKLTGITRRKFKPNLQKIRVLLPNGTVKRIRVAASVIRNGWITTKIDGKLQRVPLIKATRRRNRRKEQSPATNTATSSREVTQETPIESTASESKNETESDSNIEETSEE